ncbi:MAG: trypsin-like peptidase domain-containing protein [Candidatus Micrarchaeia archaeon]
MPTCPKCGHKQGHGKFCIKCGAHLGKTTKPDSGSFHIRIIWFFLPVFILALFGILGVLMLIGFQSASHVSINVDQFHLVCGGTLNYSVELKDTAGKGVANKVISTYVNDVLFEESLTNLNGTASFSKPITSELCGKKIRLIANFSGDFFVKNNSNYSSFLIKIPTSILIAAPNSTINNSATNISFLLINTVSNKPLSSKKLSISDGSSQEIVTNNDGSAFALVKFNETGTKKVNGEFNGDEIYLPSNNSSQDILVIPETCPDGTSLGECSSKQVGYYCNETNKILSSDCSRCGCSSGFECFNSMCVTSEIRTALLISTLQRSVVFVRQPTGTGSGIIVDQSGGQTIILTNRHVVEYAENPDSFVDTSSVTITTNDQKNATATEIRLAPSDMDLAVIYVPGILGEPANMSNLLPPLQGEDVFALGSPLGIQGSVSKGIISNFVYDYTSSHYRYDLIQTDAAINPGNSGGGLFLKSSGALIGVNRFILTHSGGSEGLNFAIDIRELQKLPHYDKWDEIPANTPKCYDFTPHNSCSAIHPGLYCTDSGDLDPKCGQCGCPSDKPICSSSGLCFSCPSGYTPYNDAGGQGFCCPPGMVGYSDRTCQ